MKFELKLEEEKRDEFINFFWGFEKELHNYDLGGFFFFLKF